MSDDYNLRAAKGQAFNLAIADALEKGLEDDKKFIYSRFVYYYELGQLLQKAPIDEIKEVLK